VCLVDAFVYRDAGLLSAWVIKPSLNINNQGLDLRLTASNSKYGRLKYWVITRLLVKLLKIKKKEKDCLVI
jgi:hypothetical protein